MSPQTITAILTRQPSKPHGTLGKLIVMSTEFCTIELPWLNNDPAGDGDDLISCIPCGVYLCKWTRSPAHGWCYELQDVPGRTHVQIHSANFAGDIRFGMKSELLGCISLGFSHGSVQFKNKDGELDYQIGVRQSKSAMAKFHGLLKGQNFQLTIMNG